MLSSSAPLRPERLVDPQNDVNYNVVVQAPYFHVTDVPTLMSVPITTAVTSLQGQMAPAGRYAPPTQPTPPPDTPIAPYLGSISA